MHTSLTHTHHSSADRHGSSVTSFRHASMFLACGKDVPPCGQVFLTCDDVAP
jgi:hypothetical protein